MIKLNHKLIKKETLAELMAKTKVVLRYCNLLHSMSKDTWNLTDHTTGFPDQLMYK